MMLIHCFSDWDLTNLLSHWQVAEALTAAEEELETAKKEAEADPIAGSSGGTPVSGWWFC